MSIAEKVNLPFMIDETLQCYISNAFFGGVLSAFNNMEEWIAEHYIQMFYVSDRFVLNTDKLESQINYYGAWSEPIQLFECQYIESKVVDNVNIVDVIKENIGNGYYCYTYFNERYVGKYRDTSHDVIIFGKENLQGKFQFAGYFNNHYGIGEISYELFREAFESGYYIALNSHHMIEQYVKFFKPRFDEKTRYLLNIKNLISRVEEYLNSINTGELNKGNDKNHFMYELPNSYYGLSLYRKWQEELTFCLCHKNRIDFRKFHVVYEHKLMMQKRLNILEQKYGNIFENEKKLAVELMNFAYEIRVLALKFNNTKKNEILEHIIMKINTLEKLDEFFMRKFLKKLMEISLACNDSRFERR